jgi:hypothetical protein
MLKIARLPENQRIELFRVTSVSAGIPLAVVEKDFWVCYTLDHLFQRSAFKEHVVLKGGTSLSKAFSLISRFSEDIDLILDWRALGYDLDEPWENRSNTKQDKFKLEAAERTEKYLNTEFAPALKSSLSNELDFDAQIRIASEEETVIFEYPRIYSLNATLDVIRLEIGSLAAWTPTVTANICSYAAEQNPGAFSAPTTTVVTVTPERSFWEKITILHQEANRPESKKMLRRYSRHYYDVYQMGNSPVRDNALRNTALLQKVVDFKTKFYRSPWAHFEDARPGTLKLTLPDYRVPELARDYQAMQEMLIGERPTLDEILEFLGKLQEEINSLG